MWVWSNSLQRSAERSNCLNSIFLYWKQKHLNNNNEIPTAATALGLWKTCTCSVFFFSLHYLLFHFWKPLMQYDFTGLHHCGWKYPTCSYLLFSSKILVLTIAMHLSCLQDIRIVSMGMNAEVGMVLIDALPETGSVWWLGVCRIVE